MEIVEGGGDRCASAPPEGRRDADGEEREGWGGGGEMVSPLSRAGDPSALTGGP